jgi:sugar phosphate isomerase/epimerase
VSCGGGSRDDLNAPNTRLSRRRVFTAVAATLAANRLQAAKARITKAKLSAVTDEIGKTQLEAIDFAKQHGLEWVDLRIVPETKKEFAALTEPELKRYASELAAAKLKVSFLRTSLLQFNWEADPKRWERRTDDVRKAIAAAQMLGTGRIGLFTGARAEHPASTFPKVVQSLEELAPIAENAKIHLAIESDPSQNVATSAELKAILDKLPSKSIGFSWDPWNAMARGEGSWADGYKLLPKERMLSVRVNADGLSSPEKIRWKSVFEVLQKDGYTGNISLATSGTGGAFIEKADDAIREMMHIVGEL